MPRRIFSKPVKRLSEGHKKTFRPKQCYKRISRVAHAGVFARTEAPNQFQPNAAGANKRHPMRIFSFAAIAGVSLLTGFSGAPAFGQQTPSSPVWSPAKAAA